MNQPESILFIGLSCVGDVIMTTPIIESLHQRYPNAVFDFVADDRSKVLYEYCPYKRNIFIKDKNLFLRGLPSLLSKLWKNSYDLIVDVRTDGLAYILRGKQRLTKIGSQPYGEHSVEKLMGVISRIHGNEPIPNTKLWLDDISHEYAKQKLTQFNDKENIIAISPGEPSKPHKNWAIKNWVEFINKISMNISGIIYMGGPSERDATDKIKAKIKTPFIDVVGNSLLESAALLDRVKIYIGPDSGLGHLAAARGTETITLFSVFGPERYLPWGGNAVSVRGKDNDARNISVSDVVDLFNKTMI